MNRKKIDNPDLYPIQLEKFVDDGRYLKFKLLYDEDTEALKLTVDDVPFEQLDYRPPSLFTTTLEAVEEGKVEING